MSTPASTRTSGSGLTTWSPLASGLLTGKYLDGVPDDSRAALPGYEWLKDGLTNERRNGQVRELMAVAERLDVSVAQLAIGWCAANPRVSTVITGASRPEQVVENMGALRGARADDARGEARDRGDLSEVAVTPDPTHRRRR